MEISQPLMHPCSRLYDSAFVLHMANCWASLAMSDIMGIKLTIMRMILHRILCDVLRAQKLIIIDGQMCTNQNCISSMMMVFHGMVINGN